MSAGIISVAFKRIYRCLQRASEGRGVILSAVTQACHYTNTATNLSTEESFI